MRGRGLVALLVLAPSLLLSGCSEEREPASPAPATTSTPAASAAPVLVIPDDFPLSDGMANGTGDDISVSAQTVGMRALDLCGRKPLRGLKPIDRLAAEVSGNEYANTRDLMLFADAGPPAAVVEDIRAAATSCPAEPLGPGSRLLTEVRDSTFGSDAAVLVHTYEQDGEVGIGAEIIGVVQVGRSLLVTSSYAEWDPATNLDEGIADEAERLADTVAAMSIFKDANPGAARAPALAATPTPIPDDFPLALRIAENESGEESVPSPEVPGIGSPRACGQRMWPTTPGRVVDRLAVRATGPEYLDSRELVSMRGVRAALGTMEEIRYDLGHCQHVERGVVWTVHFQYTGYDAITFSRTYTTGLGASAFQIIRVGKGILLTHVYGEGTLEAIGPTLRRQTRLGRDLAGEMCVFARAGC